MSTALPRECARLRERLPEYVEGRLTGGLRDRVERHLTSCTRCAAECADLRLVLRAVGSVKPEPLPEGLLLNVQSAVRQRLPRPVAVSPSWARVAVPVAVAAGIVAIAFAVRPLQRTQSLAPSVPAQELLYRRGPAAVATGPASKPPIVIAAKPGSDADTAERMLGAPREVAAGRPRAEEEPAPAPPGPAPHGAAEVTSGLSSEAPASREQTAARPAEWEYQRKTADDQVAPLGVTRESPQVRAPGRPQPGAASHAGAVACELFREMRTDTLRATAEGRAPAPPIAARAVLLEQRPPALALRLTSTVPQPSVSVYLARGDGRQLLWRGATPAADPILVPVERIGPGPGAVAVEIQSAEGSQTYLLFVPTMSRLGDTAPTAPSSQYQGQPLASVLADFSALTGLVLLAEEPLDRKVIGEVAAGKPEDVLAHIANSADLEVAAEGELVRNLTHRR